MQNVYESHYNSPHTTNQYCIKSLSNIWHSDTVYIYLLFCFNTNHFIIVILTINHTSCEIVTI